MLCIVLRKLDQIFRIVLDQRLFLAATPTLHLLFPMKRIIYAVIRLTIDQLDRQSSSGMVCARSILVFPETSFQIFGTTRVKTSVGTFKDVHVVHVHFLSGVDPAAVSTSSTASSAYYWCRTAYVDGDPLRRLGFMRTFLVDPASVSTSSTASSACGGGASCSCFCLPRSVA